MRILEVLHSVWSKRELTVVPDEHFKIVIDNYSINICILMICFRILRYWGLIIKITLYDHWVAYYFLYLRHWIYLDWARWRWGDLHMHSSLPIPIKIIVWSIEKRCVGYICIVHQWLFWILFLVDLTLLFFRYQICTSIRILWML